MHRRPSRAHALLAAVALVLGGGAVAATGPTAAAAEPVSRLTLSAPDRLVAWSYGGEVYTDLGIRVVAEDAPFELRSGRATYDDPIVTTWVGPGTQLPEELSMSSFAGLTGFVDMRITRASDGKKVLKQRIDACFNGRAQRMRPDAPARSPYPSGCPWNPYTVGSVMGVEQGFSSTLLPEWGASFNLKKGKYDVVSKITPGYREFFGIAEEDAEQITRLVVRKEEDYYERPAQRAGRTARPAAQEPRGVSKAAPEGPRPDLRSLPAWAIELNRKGTVLRFAANVWNAGDSPLVVDGFREEGEHHMTAYQYYFDSEGEQVGYDQVGEMHWHAENHQHWHFEDFARYRLLDAEDTSEVVKSTKQSFCLANTDAIDYTVPGADWDPENTDLSTSCGERDALSVRQVLSSGSGDTYYQYRYGQAFGIKNVPKGTYLVAVEANPERNLVESDTTNNDSFREVTIGGKPGGRRTLSVAPVGIIDESSMPW